MKRFNLIPGDLVLTFNSDDYGIYDTHLYEVKKVVPPTKYLEEMYVITDHNKTIMREACSIIPFNKDFLYSVLKRVKNSYLKENIKELLSYFK